MQPRQDAGTRATKAEGLAGSIPCSAVRLGETDLSHNRAAHGLDLLLPKKSDLFGSHHRVQRRRQHFLNLRLDPQGQRSLRPSFSRSSLSA
jgi:hypothetical protein